METTVEWKPIFDGAYQVSSDGRVRQSPSFPHRERVGELTPCVSEGYPRVALNIRTKNGGRQRHVHIHRLMMMAFRGPCPKGLEVAHLNGVRHDNRLENLAYVTPKENSSHRKAHGTELEGERNHNATITSAIVREIRRACGAGEKQVDVAKRLRLSPTHVHSVYKRKSWKSVE